MLEVDGPKGNPEEAWERIRDLLGPFTRRFPEKRAHRVAYLLAVEYNIGKATWPSSTAKRKASVIAKHARSLAADLGNVSTELLLQYHRLPITTSRRRSKAISELIGVASLNSCLLPVTKRALDENDDGIASWKSRLSALASLNDIVVRSEKKKVRKIPYLKEELAFSCVCFLTACGKPCSLSKGGKVAQLAAAEFEWATGDETDSGYFDFQIVKLQQRRRTMNALEGDNGWDDEVRRHADAIVHGDWPSIKDVEFVEPTSLPRTI